MTGLVQIEAGSLEQELAGAVSGEVRFDKISRALYSTDASVYQIEPAGVVIPKTREDIINAFAICRKHRVPVTMRGGGTSQAGQAIGEGVQIDTSKYYNRLLELNLAEGWVRVEPGIVLDELNAQLAPHGVRFAPDISTASRACIGGMMANNSAGARSVLYGKTIDHVLEQTVLLSDGSIVEFRDVARDQAPIWGDSLESRCYRTVLKLAEQHADEIDRRYPKVLRRVGGYNLDEFVDSAKPVNLAKLMVGSEGTLGIVLEAKLKLVPLPKAKAVMVIEFADLLESLAATPVILTHKPSAVEVMDKAILQKTSQNAGLDKLKRTFIKGDPASTLCVEFYADRKEDLPSRLAALEKDLRGRKLGYAYHSDTGPTQQQIWSLREAALGLSMAMKEDAKSISFVEDTAVAPERLRDFIERFLQVIRKHGTTAGIYAHASVGCLHVRPVVNMKTAEGVRKFEAIAQDVADLVLEFGGALSGEHGDGLVRSPFMKQMFGPVLYEAFREIKRTFDPDGSLNPGKIVEAPPLTTNLRFGVGYETPNPTAWFDYSEYGGLGGAVEMCSGVGACRKKLSGTMCPSFMATKDEAHTTRGRANVLRLAMAGKLGEAGLGDDGVKQVLNLCLECRACKAECPVGVDMARYKSEFLADYYQRHGTPRQARALGNVHQLAEWGSRFAPLSNWIASSGPARWANEKLLGIDARRPVPKWRRGTFLATTLQADNPSVILFADTFTNHYDPEIGVAAVRILERMGHAVALRRPACCGRPLISQGLLKEAQKQAVKLVTGLHPLISRGQKILFLEPSCLSAVKEDAPDLLRGDQQRKARELAQACMLFEEFAAGLDLPLRPGPRKVLLHGHCHQKSMGMLKASQALLAKIPEATLVDLDAGCCGMAGSFGYAKENYEVSRAIASRKLLPAIENMDRKKDVLVAPGTSCRHQMADLADYEAVHPAVLIQSLLR